MEPAADSQMIKENTMKYEWEELDIKPGRRVDSHNRAEQYILGFDAAINKEQGNLVLVSLADGMVSIKEHSATRMADHLNQCKMRPVEIAED